MISRSRGFRPSRYRAERSATPGRGYGKDAGRQSGVEAAVPRPRRVVGRHVQHPIGAVHLPPRQQLAGVLGARQAVVVVQVDRSREVAFDQRQACFAQAAALDRTAQLIGVQLEGFASAQAGGHPVGGVIHLVQVVDQRGADRDRAGMFRRYLLGFRLGSTIFVQGMRPVGLGVGAVPVVE